MVVEEKARIVFEVDAASFKKGAADVEVALRRQRRELEEHGRALDKEILALKRADQPNKERIRALQLERQALRQNITDIRAKVSALRDEAAAFKKSNEQTKQLQGSTQGLFGGVTSLKGAFIGLAGAIPLVQTIKSVDAFNTLQARIKSATDATGDYIGVSKELNRISIETGTRLEDNVDLFQRLSFSAEALGASNQDIIRFSESVSKLGVIGGSSTESISAGTLQLAQALSQGRVQAEEINSVLENLPALAKRIEQGLGLLPGQLKNAVKEGKVLSKDILKAILDQSEDIDKEFSKFPNSLGRSIQSANTSFITFIAKIDRITGLTSGLSNLINLLGQGFNFLSDAVTNAAVNLGKFLKTIGLGKANVAPVLGSIVGGPVGLALGSLTKVNPDDLIKLGEKGAVSKKKTNGFTPPPKDKKKKTGNKNPGKDLITNIQQAGKSQVESDLTSLDIEFEKLGPFTTELEKFGNQAKKLARESEILIATEAKIKAVKAKTKEEIEAQTEALRANGIEQQKNTLDTLKIQNEIKAFNTQDQEKILRAAEQERLSSIDQIKDREVAASQEVLEIREKEFKEGKITIEEFYSTKGDLIESSLQAEIDASNKSLEILQSQLERAQQIKDKDREREIQASISAEKRKQEDLRDNAKKETDKTAEERKDALNESAKTFGDNLTNVIQQALEDGFLGNSPLSVLKSFVQNLRKLMASTLAQALAEGFKKSELFKGITQSVGSLIDKITGRSPGGGGATSALSSLLKFAKANPLTLAGLAAVAGGSFLTKKSKGAVGTSVGLGLGVGGGTLAGSIFGPVGTVVGGILGGVSATASANQDSFLGRNKGKIIGSVLGGIGGFFLGGALDKKNKKKAEDAKKLARTQAFIDSQLSGADQNNLQDLEKRLNSILRFKSGSNNGVRAKRQAADQLRQLIAAREASIKDAIKEIERQNTEIKGQISLINAKPGEEIKIQRELDLQQLVDDTQKLLDQFKDSEEAKTKILEQEALKRKLIDEQEKKRFESNAQDLADLLNKRDAISNRNVFTRAKSAEQLKADDLQSIDKDIAAALLTLNEQSKLGFNAPNVAGINQLLQAAQTAGNFQGQLNIQINGAQDPNAVSEEVLRAVTGFFKKNLGVNIT